MGNHPDILPSRPRFSLTRHRFREELRVLRSGDLTADSGIVSRLRPFEPDRILLEKEKESVSHRPCDCARG